MMVMSASRSDSLEITKEDFTKSVEILEKTERRMHKTFGGLGKAPHSDVSEKIMNYLKTMKVTTRSQLLMKFHHDVDTATLREIEELMTQMKVIKPIKILPTTGERIYEWNDAFVEKGNGKT